MAVDIHFHGHATFSIHSGETQILVDPFFTSNPVSDTTAEEVEATHILITHGHFDHVEDAVKIAQRTGAKVIANFEIGNWLIAQGVAAEQVHQQHIGGGFNHGEFYLKLTPALHGSSLPDNSYGGMPGGLYIEIDKRKIYITGDTGLFSDMAFYRGADLLILPIGDNFTMGPADAKKAIQFVQPTVAIPCHYNTWPPIEQDAEQWASEIRKESSTKVRVLNSGESTSI